MPLWKYLLDYFFKLTEGIAIINITAQVEAGFPEKSAASPAIIPPIIPPTSNKVDKLAAVSDSTLMPVNQKKIILYLGLFCDH